MSAWGVAPWDNDYAADWFPSFFCEKSMSAASELVFNFDHRDERQYHQIRALAFVMQSLCRPYVWPESDGVDPKELLERTTRILENMVNPELEDWTFLNMWPDEAAVVESVRFQISELQERNSEWIPL